MRFYDNNSGTILKIFKKFGLNALKMKQYCVCALLLLRGYGNRTNF